MNEYYKMAIKYLQQQEFTVDYFFLGNPRTIITNNLPLPLLRQWNGHNPIFISHNTYPSYSIIDSKVQPSSITLRRIFFDFDHLTKPENAFADAKRLSSYLAEYNISHIVHYSGSKGFHVFIQLKPVTYKLTIKSETALKNKVAKLQLYFRDVLHLKTLDYHIVGDVKRLVRVPYLYHQASKRIPFPTNVLQYNDISSILEQSVKPKFSSYASGQRFSLPELYHHLNINSYQVKQKSIPLQYTTTSKDETVKNYTLQLMASKPCILNALTSNNPSHYARVQACLFAKENGISMQSFLNIWDELAKTYHYVDYYNTQYRLSQIRNIYENPRYVHEASCGTINNRTYLCLGKPIYGKDGTLMSGCIKYRSK